MEEQLLAVAREVQRRIIDAMTKMTAAEIEDSGFGQYGLRDGAEIIEEHVRYGEPGVAFEHVIYMLRETAISLPASSVRVLEQAAAVMGLPVPQIPVDP